MDRKRLTRRVRLLAFAKRHRLEHIALYLAIVGMLGLVTPSILADAGTPSAHRGAYQFAIVAGLVMSAWFNRLIDGTTRSFVGRLATMVAAGPIITGFNAVTIQLTFRSDIPLARDTHYLTSVALFAGAMLAGTVIWVRMAIQPLPVYPAPWVPPTRQLRQPV